MTQMDQRKFNEQMRDSAWLTEQIARGVRRALAENKRKNNPVAIWEKGEVKIVPPEDIPDEACDFEMDFPS